ncbi:ATP-dependent DNA helicase RecG [Psychroflexus halocasei]|uniref:ATP-dependent DNA helicase RecG n=1 Tax=Psychroflexus halocasei TaxID=908615 RepID=A0A1H3Y3N2_9FLAO|nr:ATP-dependent DNA helicase RecG [Psychroflexus halocasei]SEA05691.1 ATP-dependent DNA helicase RecG [Psychroflexus halocasei]
MNASKLQTPIEYLKGVGPQKAEVLKKEFDVFVFQDLLNIFPNRYIDKSSYRKISELREASVEVQIIGKITGIRYVKQKKGKRLVADFEDETGHIELVWFRSYKWILDKLKTNVTYVVFGKLNYFNGQFSIAHPEIELLETHKNKGRIPLQPVYPSSEKLIRKGVSNTLLMKSIYQLLSTAQSVFVENLPKSICEDLKLMDRAEAMRHIHFPKSLDHLSKAQFRFKFEEFFFVQLRLLRQKIVNQKKIKGYTFSKVGTYFNEFYKNGLSFELTNAQKRVLREIRKDVGSNAQMNRLLQGDVGSGKTIVGFMSMLMAIDNGFQACLMAPTEILAQQHYEGISELCESLDLNVAVLTGSSKTKERKKIHDDLMSGELHLLIGTHALIEDKVQFKNLGLAIIDEQHRFGVKQRAKLWKKNDLPPHVLVMTATPIPRTLAMSLYGDLDISVIDELPPGRKPIKTVHRFDSHRLSVFQFIRDEIDKGRQVYIVYPLIEESSNFDYKDLMDGYESIARDFPMPKYQTSILHGQMKPEDKAYEMQRFAEGKTHIMVATTVIEVGVNVPNASVMIIESAERFGLSQLHQLRGRVGRGAEQSYCILMTGKKLGEDAKTRMQAMTQTNDGFKLSEIDLKLRGPGDLMGTQQSGVLDLKIADLVKDNQLLKTARSYAQHIVKNDPGFEHPEHQVLISTYNQLTKGKTIWNYIS